MDVAALQQLQLSEFLPAVYRRQNLPIADGAKPLFSPHCC
jgi:hypothetical protein